MFVNSKYKIGDTVICAKGFNTTNFSALYGGLGYQDGKIFTIREITISSSGQYIYWAKSDFSGGIYERALEEFNETKMLLTQLRKEISQA